jgi:hypothetical protein
VKKIAFPGAIAPSVTLVVAMLGFLFAVKLVHAAEKPSWQATWEQTVAAAKKEGRLNFYVGRYGTEPISFPK